MRAQRESRLGRGVVIAAVLLSAAVSVSVIGGSARAAVPVGNGRIACDAGSGNSLPGGGPEVAIFTLNPDGSDLRQLTYGGQHNSPAWSPDGGKIVYVVPQPADHKPIPTVLWVVNADGTDNHPITPVGYYHDPTWSPDGGSIAFDGKPGPDPAYPEASSYPFTAPWGIWIMDADGTEPRVVVESTPAGNATTWPSWSPDGSRLAYTDQSSGVSEIDIVDIGTSDTAGVGAGDFARWSPDGKHLVVQSGSGIGFLSLDGSPAGVSGYQGLLFSNSVAWSPDGTFLAYSDADGYLHTNLGGDHSLGIQCVQPAFRPVGGATDSTPPITSDDAPTGWVNHDVTIHLTATDADSGVAATHSSVDGGADQGATVVIPAPADGSNDGMHTVTYYSVDSAGNAEAPHSVSVGIDTGLPQISYQINPIPNGQGWNKSDVTVTFTCTDSLSGIHTCTDPVTLGRGGNQSVTGTAVDMAGNTRSITVSPINVDETAPSLAGTPTTDPLMGWYRGNVTIHWSCSDDLSGTEPCPGDDVITGEGTGLTASASVSDLAGNVTAASSTPVNIDRTAPLTTASAPSAWVNTGVTVTLSALDNLSGVAATHYRLDGGTEQTGTSVPITDEGIHTMTYWSVDVAGNVESAKMLTVRIDKTAPNITHTLNPAPNGASWNNTSVFVKFLCEDALSGISFCTAIQLVSTEGQAQPVYGQAVDGAGNIGHDTAYVSIDETKPTITAAADRASNTAGWYNAPVIVTFTCGDPLSGVKSCTPAITLHEGASQSATGTAIDLADNTNTATLSGINVDTTAPIVTYTGNAGAYTVDQTVNITCGATDNLSGVASTTCSNISGPAWSFGLGTTSRSASATDRAGNTGTGSTSFTVVVNATSLDSLITQFFGGDTYGANGLITKADMLAAGKGSALKPFDDQVDAKTGHPSPTPAQPLSQAEADFLKQVAASLVSS